MSSQFLLLEGTVNRSALGVILYLTLFSLDGMTGLLTSPILFV